MSVLPSRASRTAGSLSKLANTALKAEASALDRPSSVVVLRRTSVKMAFWVVSTRRLA